MRGILIFLAGAVVGAGIGIFAYKKYEVYAETRENDVPTDEETDDSEPVDNFTTETSEEHIVEATPDEETASTNDYAACFNRLNKLKEHEETKKSKPKEEPKMSKQRYEIILEDNFRRFDFPCYQLEYHLRDGTISDEYDGTLTDESIVATIGDTYDEVRRILVDTADNCVYVRDHEAEEDYEIIAVED